MRTRKHSSLVSFVAGASFLLLATTDTMAGSRNATTPFDAAKHRAYISLLEKLIEQYDDTSANQVQSRKHERSNAMTASIDFQGAGPAKCPRCGATIDTRRHKIGQSADAPLYKAMGLKQVRIRCPGCKTEMDVIEK